MAETTPPGDTIGALSPEALTAAQSVDLLGDALTGMFQTLRDKSETIGKLTSSLGSLTLANTLYSSDLYKTVIMGMEEAARVPRTIAAEIAGGNILAGTALNEQAKILFEDATRTQTALQTKIISFGLDATGQEIKRNATLLYKDAADLNKAYTDSVLRESALYSAGIKALNKANAYDMKESTDLAMRGLGLDATAVRQIYQREYAHTGEITGKYIENFAATILAGEKLTGLSKKALTEDVSRMLADFNMYGKYSESQMIVLSKTVHDLGIDLTAASASAQKFMSFEGATQAAANVTALTGVVIDSQKLFYLSNTDQAAYLLEQRKILRQMDFEHFDIVKQNAVVSELGLRSVADAMAIRNSQLDSSTGKVSADAIALLAKTDDYQGEALKTKERQAAAFDMLRAMNPDEQFKTTGAIKNLAGGTEELGKAIETFNNRLIQTSAEVTPVMITAGKEVSNAFSVGLVKASDIISKLQAGTADFFKSGGFAQVVTTFEAMMSGVSTAVLPLLPRSMPPLWAKVLEGMGLFKTEFKKILDSVDTSLSSTLDNMSKNVDQKGNFRTVLVIETKETSTAANSAAVAQPPKAPVPPAPAVDDAGVPASAPAPTESRSTATAETTDMKIKLHFEIDGDKMNDMIDLRVQEIITGQITFLTPVGGNRPGGYRIKFVEASK